MAARTPRLCADQGTIDSSTKTITFKALPYPMPDAWIKEFKDAAKNHAGDFVHLEALEIRARESIGIEYTRKVVMPVVRS